MIKNVFITGLPGCGKTTLLKEVLEELKLNAGGFYTQEIREKGIRKGFKIITLDGKEGILAHVNIKNPYRVSKYGVNIEDIDRIAVPSILEGLKENKIIVVDEIGKAELFSKKFKQAVLKALDSKNKVLGTIMLEENPFCDEIKKRKDTKIFYLKRENRGEIKKEILWHFQNLQQKR
ncbi:MAG: NTPase [Minisyncoccales bacterium]